MTIHRYSATEICGIPLHNVSEVDTHDKIRRLMESYGVDPTEVDPMAEQDITPYYWDNVGNNFRYLLSSQRRGHAVVKMVPVHTDSTAYEVLGGAGLLALGETPLRTIRIPEDQECIVIAGEGSPRYAGKLCIHEALVNL